MRDHAGPVTHPQICSLQQEFQTEDRFRFTPVKRASNTIPRLWDRKPSTSFLGRASRPRKVWKRFRTSFNSMKALQQMIGADRPLEETELDTEINESRSAGLLRGVKRRCLGVEAIENGGERGRSFLETKWESEIGRRRRKLSAPYSSPMADESERSDFETGQESSTSDLEADLTQDSIETDESVDIEPISLITIKKDTAYPEMLHGTSSCQQIESEESDIDVEPRDDFDPTITGEEPSNTTAVDDQQPTHKNTVPAQEITSVEQESTLVRSALQSSLDGEDAELLNNFLTKARAKRAAKAAMAVQENVEEKVTKEEEVPDLPTPRSRRALGELDANSPSPSPQKVRIPSPKKAEDPAGSPLRKEIANKDKEQAGDEQQQSSPVTRRSTRVRVPPRTTTTAIRNTLSLRRAKGTEFVFLQRTEAQELALATRKNTRQNKGNAVFPKYVLKNLAQKQESDEGFPSPVRRVNKKGRRVCWNDARLVEFEDGDEPQPGPSDRESSHELSDDSSAQSTKKEGEKRKTTGSGGRNTRSQKGSQSKGMAPPKTAATPLPAGRVRKLGGSSATPTKPKSAPSPAPSSSSSETTTATPTGKRKKLTPKSPSSALLSPPKNASSTTTTKAPASKVPKPTASGRTSTAAKSKSIFKANAGSTPMPKRVRARS